MIIEGFEIENWTCIKKLSVSGLPSRGVIVLHGPNRRGKSSLVRALRACLMDFPSTSTSSKLKSAYPRGSGEKPTVTVTFRAGGKTYRVKKYFGTSKSDLASQTSTGDWRVEADTAADAHRRVCEMAGGDDSEKGMHQLLWLTQAEFRLPDPKTFDPNVQAQLRGILGVLQTPLDDRFFDRVRKRWNEWYSGRRKAGKQQQIKDGCRLAQELDSVAAAREELAKCEVRFQEMEGLLRQVSELEARRLDLNRQRNEQATQLRKRQDEHDRSQARIAARRLAEARHSSAEKEQQAALAEERQRSEAARRLVEAQSGLEPAKRDVDRTEQIVRTLEGTQAQRKTSLSLRRDEERDLQQRASGVAARMRALDDFDKLSTARNAVQQAQEVARAIEELKTYFTHNPVPDDKTLAEMKTVRQRILQLQVERDAASMILRVVASEGVVPAQLALDGGKFRTLPDAPAPASHSVRRKAVLQIPAWGCVELSRGSADGDFDEIEAELRRCADLDASGLESLGIAANAPDAFEQLLRRIAEHGLKSKELHNQEQAFKKVAPQGLEPLQRKVLELDSKLKDAEAASAQDPVAVPSERDRLEELRTDLGTRIGEIRGQITSLEDELEGVETKLSEGRADVVRAKELLAGREATATSRQQELGRLRAEEQIATRLLQARRDLVAAAEELTGSELTPEESTVNERLEACKEAIAAVEGQIRDNDEKYNRIKGRLESTEGLHAERMRQAARVDELMRLTEREELEKAAVDRLYELFEECRQKQLGTLMGPIHNRVLAWMRILDIGDYKELRFSDAFLPDKLVRRDGTAELSIDEESTGAQEQIGMLVRVALGSVLTSDEEPAVAILDDPLTHCDVLRLNTMRAILRRAAQGDSELSPPAGPLQIIILTCHPEWFRDERATVIDLDDPEVLQRFDV